MSALRPAAFTVLCAAATSGCMTTSQTPSTLEAAGVQRSVSAAETNCLAATNSQLGRSDASMVSVAPSEAGTVVIMSVPGASADWRCVARADGAVQSVDFLAEG